MPPLRSIERAIVVNSISLAATPSSMAVWVRGIAGGKLPPGRPRRLTAWLNHELFQSIEKRAGSPLIIAPLPNGTSIASPNVTSLRVLQGAGERQDHQIPPQSATNRSIICSRASCVSCVLRDPLKGGGGKSMLAQNLGVKFPVQHRIALLRVTAIQAMRSCFRDCGK
jgi:hypothetical protein